MKTIDMTNFKGRKKEGRDYSIALRDMLPQHIGEGMEPKTKQELAKLTGRSFETLTRLFKKIHGTGIHIAGWQRGTSGEPAAMWILGPGEDVPRPGPMSSAEKNKRYRATEHGWKTSRQASDNWKKSERGQEYLAKYNQRRLERYHARNAIKRNAYAVLKQADPLLAAIMGVRA